MCTCEPGTMLVADQCVGCEVGKFKSDFGIHACDHCEAKITSSVTASANSTSVDECFCPAGHFLSNGGTKCAKAVRGVELNRKGMTLQTLALKPGTWRTDPESIDIRDCPVEDACVGGNATYCLEGHLGPYCNLCEDGFSKDVFNICHLCSTSFFNLAMSFVTMLVGMLLVAGLVLAFKRYEKKVLANNAEKREQVKKVKRAIVSACKILFVMYQVSFAVDITLMVVAQANTLFGPCRFLPVCLTLFRQSRFLKTLR